MYYFTLLIQLQFLPKVKSLRNSGIFSWNIDNLYFKHNERFPKKFHYLKKKNNNKLFPVNKFIVDVIKM